MDQNALLAQLAQLNAGMTHSGIAPMRAGTQLRQGLSSSGLASSPCFSMPGLMLQGFNGLQQHTTQRNQQAGSALLANTSFQTLLNASHASANPTSQVPPLLCTVCASLQFPPRGGRTPL
jgi:hypothetical protein